MTDNKLILSNKEFISVCCDNMDWIASMWDIAKYLVPPSKKDNHGWMLWMGDGDCIPFNFCPSCGTKVELI